MQKDSANAAFNCKKTVQIRQGKSLFEKDRIQTAHIYLR